MTIFDSFHSVTIVTKIVAGVLDPTLVTGIFASEYIEHWSILISNSLKKLVRDKFHPDLMYK